MSEIERKGATIHASDEAWRKAVRAYAATGEERLEVLHIIAQGNLIRAERDAAREALREIDLMAGANDPHQRPLHLLAQDYGATLDRIQEVTARVAAPDAAVVR